MITCKLEACENKPHAKDFCRMHYLRMYRHGNPNIILDPSGGRPTIKDPEVIMKKIILSENGCWVFLGANVGGGYMRLQYNGKSHLAHRWFYRFFKNKTRGGIVIDHICRNRCCVNPEHLEEVSLKENVFRGEGITAKNHKKTKCPQGHKYSNKNTYLYKTGRYCKVCRAQSSIKYRENKKCLKQANLQ